MRFKRYKRYGSITAVQDVSFRVESGQILGFLGPNGAGKTTTMRILTGCLPPTEGKAIVAGCDISEAPIEAKRRTGYLPETPPLYPDMTVREYLTFYLTDQWRDDIAASVTNRFRDGPDEHHGHGRPTLPEVVQGLPAAGRAGPSYSA